MTAPRLTVTYGLDADAYLVARAVDRALEGAGVHTSVQQTEAGDMGVWLVERGDPMALGRWFLPGEQLVVTYDDGWRIEGVPATAVAP